MTRLLAVPLALVLLALGAAPALAGHRLLPNSQLPTKLQRSQSAIGGAFAAERLLAPTVATGGFTVGVPAGAPVGPCTDVARRAMPDHVGHNHRDPAQHQFQCRLQQVAYLPLIEELGEQPDVVFGEMDVKADIAAVSVTYPEAGAVFFDVSDPAKPRFLDFFRGRDCETTVLAVNCGAFVDLNADASLAFVAVQTVGVEPVPDLGGSPLKATPGIDVVDLRALREGGEAELVQYQPTQPVTPDIVAGSHTARSHVIPEGPEGAGREPGEYLFAVENYDGVLISSVDKESSLPLQEVGSIDVDDIHDIFISDDPIDGRTYLYIAAGFASGFYAYDITDPTAPKLVAEWDLTPECEDDWYAHTIDVAYRGGRRYVTLPAELFDAGSQSGDDRAEGCGDIAGNGDQVGPLWIVDASDFSKLGPADASDGADTAPGEGAVSEMKAASEAALVTTWTNPAERAGRNFTFSPHNQQIVGDVIYLSHYHGGVYALDAAQAFSGRVRGPAARPSEIGVLTPNGTPVRPIRGAAEDAGEFDQGGDGFTEGLNRGEIWDAYAYKGHVFAADMIGGFYSLRLADGQVSTGTTTGGGQGGGGGGGTTQTTQPTCRFSAPQIVNTSVRRSGRGARLAFTRRADAPVTVDVFQQSIGRRVIGERLVARFSNRRRGFTWNGRANRRGQRVRDGYLLVRYTMRNGATREVRRVVARRTRGRFAQRPAHERREGCSTFEAFKLERPVFGGRTNRALGISFRVAKDMRVSVQVLRGSRVVRRFTATTRRAGVTHRLRLAAEGLRRGEYRVRITGAGTTIALTARRL